MGSVKVLVHTSTRLTVKLKYTLASGKIQWKRDSVTSKLTRPLTISASSKIIKWAAAA
jgi:hypothetical protein